MLIMQTFEELLYYAALANMMSSGAGILTYIPYILGIGAAVGIASWILTSKKSPYVKWRNEKKQAKLDKEREEEEPQEKEIIRRYGSKKIGHCPIKVDHADRINSSKRKPWRCRVFS